MTNADSLADGWHPWTWRVARDHSGTARAVQRFRAYAANPSAAAALASWLHHEALNGYTSTYIELVNGDVAAFVALQSATVALRKGQARRLGLPDEDHVPGALVTHLARSTDYAGHGRTAMLYAASIARRVDQVQRTRVLIVDPFDAATEQMWRTRFGFWSTRERASNGCRRLYHPIPGRTHA